MSGLVAVVSRDEAVRARGVARAGWLRRLPTYDCLERDAGGVRVAVCGVGREASIAGVGRAGEPLAAVAGEILNAASVARELGAPHGDSFAELTLRAYAAWGRGLFRHLEGAFALVVVDAGRECVLAGSDPYGVKPLYHVTLGDDVLLATEAKTFAADPRFVAAPDETAVASVLATGHDLSRGLFAGVHALREGRLLEVEQGRAREVTYWSARESVGRLRGEAYIDGLADAMQSLAPDLYDGDGVLLPLTGGLDSRLLGAVCPDPARVTAVTFGAAGDADATRAVELAAALGMRHRLVPYERRLPGRARRRHGVAHRGPAARDGEHHRLPDGGLPATGLRERRRFGPGPALLEDPGPAARRPHLAPR